MGKRVFFFFFEFSIGVYRILPNWLTGYMELSWEDLS